MSLETLGLLALTVRVWAIVRMQPWLRASTGAFAEVFAVGLGVALAGLTISPATLADLALTASHPTPTCPGGSALHASCGAPWATRDVVRFVIGSEIVFGTIVGLCLGLVSSAWTAALGSPTFTTDLLGGRPSAAFVAVVVSMTALLVFDAGVHRAALLVLQRIALAPGLLALGIPRDDGVSLPIALVDAGLGVAESGLAAHVFGLVSVTMAATTAFVVAAGFPILAIDVSRHSIASGAPMLAPASALLADLLRPAVLLLWLTVALATMPSAWIDVFLAEPSLGR